MDIMIFRRVLISISISLFLFQAFTPAVSAQIGILPIAPQCAEGAEECSKKCEKAIRQLQGKSDESRLQGAEGMQINQILGCAIKYGHVQLWMFPFFITEFIQFLVAIAGAISMLFIVIGGYHYIIGGITDEKEKGKKTVLYAISGLVVTLASWIIINIVQTFLVR